MSRRRRHNATHDVFVRVICTGRGQHVEADLGLLSWSPPGVYDAGDGLGSYDHGGGFITERGGRRLPGGRKTPSHLSMVRANGRTYLRYRCHLCGRDIPLRWDTATAIVRDLVGVSERTLDVSLL